MKWHEVVIAAHLRVTDAVSHDTHMQSDRYFVWGERGANDLMAGNVHAEKAVLGYTDLYTKLEFDPWKEQIEQSFDTFGLFWALNSVQYEENTGFTHYEWYWSVTDDA